MSSTIRPLWFLAGWLALIIGLIGIVVPLLPTTPFILLAAWCLSRTSPRLERWLLDHPRFGPIVRDWREHRAISLRAKQLATVTMAGSALISGFLLPLVWCWVPAAICAVVALFLWRLPTRVTVRSN